MEASGNHILLLVSLSVCHRVYIIIFLKVIRRETAQNIKNLLK